MIENIDRRVLGAFQWIDAISRKPVLNALPVLSKSLKLRAKPGGLYVVFDAPGMTELTTQFDVTSPWPAPATFEVQVDDASRQYLPRRAQVAFPRALTPLSDPNSVLAPQRIALYPAPAAPTAPNWAVLRISVRDAAKKSLPWAATRILRTSDNTVLATGMTDRRGEGLLAIPGLGVRANANGGGAVMESSVAVMVQAIFDPSVLNQNANWVPDPDLLLQAPDNPAFRRASVAAQVAGGAVLPITISIAL
jgi:hypothetical protein